MERRVKELRRNSLESTPYISMERADLITEAYRIYENDFDGAMLRAKCFEYYLTKKEISIEDGELIVGERGPTLQASPTYPELCCHSVDDLKMINDRKKIRFSVAQMDLEFQEKTIIPFWKDRSIRKKILNKMSSEWIDSYESGIFTEFMEQRAPGHTVADKKVFQKGFLNIIGEINEELQKQRPIEEINELKAMKICAEAIMKLSLRYSLLAKEMALIEKDSTRKRELEMISNVCRNIPSNPPRSFHEALQTYWFVHLGVIMELNTWDSFSPGRLDQHLIEFYRRDKSVYGFEDNYFEELLQCFWIKFNNQPAPPKVGITLKESGTYTDFANISLGGISTDNQDGVNELSYLILNVIKEMKLLQPSTNIQVSKKNPDKFIMEALKVIEEGRGQPSVFNADGVVRQLMNQGKTYQDAIEGGTSGCVETGSFGKEAYILTGYFNLTKILELALNDGFDKYSNKQLGIKTGKATEFRDFNELYDAFEAQLNYFIDIKIKGNHVIEEIYAKEMAAPFMSLVIDDCIKKGRNYNAGGARYNTRYIQGVGIGTITNSLSAIKKHVYDDKRFTMERLMNTLDSNFLDMEFERRVLKGLTPNYGNDDNYADEIMVKVFNSFKDSVDGRKTYVGGDYRINMLPTTCHVYFGSVVGATPDGRKSYKPLSEGISPSQGTDKGSPTAVIKSASKMDQYSTGGTLLNQKFSPELLKEKKGKEAVKNLIRTYFDMGGHHIQFNVIKKETLLNAQKSPENYKDLIVRVAGYSDYFNNLNKDLQDEIIDRREYKSL